MSKFSFCQANRRNIKAIGKCTWLWEKTCLKRISVVVLILISAGFPLMSGLLYAQPEEPACIVRLEADPPGTTFRFSDFDSAVTSPIELRLPPGSIRITASLPGYQSLTYDLVLNPNDTVGLNFIMLANQPERPTPEDLSQSYQPIIPLLPEDQAQRVRQRYNALTEIFAIIPLCQGLMAHLVLGGGNDYFSTELIIGGACLSVSTYLLGRKMTSRKLAEIREQNQKFTAQNADATEHNRELDRRIQQIYAETMRQWQAELLWRGKVEIIE